MSGGGGGGVEGSNERTTGLKSEGAHYLGDGLGVGVLHGRPPPPLPLGTPGGGSKAVLERKGAREPEKGEEVRLELQSDRVCDVWLRCLQRSRPYRSAEPRTLERDGTRGVGRGRVCTRQPFWCGADAGGAERSRVQCSQ